MQESVSAPAAQRNAEVPSTASKEAPQQVSLQQLFEQFHTSDRGLTSQEARRRLGEVGPNELASVKRIAGIRQLLLLFTNPLVLILLAASVVSAIFGEVVDASIIIVIVLLSAILNFLQTHRSQRAVERLRAKVALTATALRAGSWCAATSFVSRRVILCLPMRGCFNRSTCTCSNRL